MGSGFPFDTESDYDHNCRRQTHPGGGNMLGELHAVTEDEPLLPERESILSANS